MKDRLIPGIHYPAVACGVFIFNTTGQFLMLLRSENARNDKGMWGIPGGLVEFGEKVEDAVIREAKEECGLDINNLELKTYYSHLIQEQKAHFLSLLFVTTQYIGEAKIGELEKFIDIAWFFPNALPKNTSIVVTSAIQK